MGSGIRAARAEEELAELLAQAAMEADAAFGDGSLYLEKMLVDARHVEVQVLGDAHGNLIHLFERECSLQRRRQKLFEESPSPALDADTRDAMTDAALRHRRAQWATRMPARSSSCSTRDRAFYFIEMNTRIQVEHPVTELVTGIDLVKEQLRVAPRRAALRPSGRGRGRPAPRSRSGSTPRIRSATSCPSPGKITALELPGGPGVRVDTAAYAGYHVPPFYDSLVAKLICCGPRPRRGDRAHAPRARGVRGRKVSRTTIPFHLELLDDPAVEAGDYHVEFLERRAEASGRITQ